MRLDDVVVRAEVVCGVVAADAVAVVELNGDAVAEPGDGANRVALHLAHEVHPAPVERRAFTGRE